MKGLLSPLKVRNLELRNRIVLPPMATGLPTEEGRVTEELVNHYRARAKHCGMVIVEHSYVHKTGQNSAKQLAINRDELVEGLEKLATAIKKEGAVAIAQISHAGTRADSQSSGTVPAGPSSTNEDGETRALAVSEISEIEKAFADAAERAMTAGFNGIEFHGAHSFLLNQFYSPITNHRDDQFGGSFNNRIRFPLRVVKRARKIVNDRLLLYRMGVVDFDPQGIDIKQSQRFAKKLEETGVDILDVSGGLCGSRPKEITDEQGFFVPQAGKIKQSVSVPVIGVGGITDPKYADKVIRAGLIDLAAVGRAQLADAGWAKNATEVLQ